MRLPLVALDGRLTIVLGQLVAPGGHPRTLTWAAFPLRSASLRRTGKKLGRSFKVHRREEKGFVMMASRGQREVIEVIRGNGVGCLKIMPIPSKFFLG